MRLRVCLLCATCLISAGSLGAQDVERVGVAFSLPGGSSYAAYQGGVVTAVLSFMRASNAGGLDALYRAEGRVPRRYDLEAAVGSSAGGANALLAAIGWCMEEIPAPARSPHWEAWVPVGLSQLAPGADEASGGAFSRRFLREVYADTMRNAVDRATACSDEVRIGFALTRQDPDTLSIMGAIAVPTQKVATALKLSPRGAISPLDISGYPEVGKTILLADSGVSAAMRAIYATSAFPAAFAPVALQYAGDAGAAPVEDWFYDGGVFDDNPLWLLRSMIEARPPDGDRVHVVYVDPSRRAAATEGSDTDSVYFGVDQIRHMVRTAVPTARRSELSALARLPSGAVEMVPSLTTRYPAVFGSTLSNFGAFLSRSFREYDFVAGYYDGLRFAAQALACPPGAVFSCDDEPMDSSHRLVSELPLEDPALQSAFVALADCMASTPPDPVERCGDSGVGETDIRSRLLHAYVDVAPEIDAAHRADAVECTGASSMMCRSGLPEVFRALRSTEGLIGAIRQEAEPCVWDPNVSDWESDACPNRGFVERDLLDWIESPGLTFVRTADALIIRLMAASGRAADCGSSCASEVEGTSASSLLGAFWWYHRQSAPEAASSTNMGNAPGWRWWWRFWLPLRINVTTAFGSGGNGSSSVGVEWRILSRGFGFDYDRWVRPTLSIAYDTDGEWPRSIRGGARYALSLRLNPNPIVWLEGGCYGALFSGDGTPCTSGPAFVRADIAGLISVGAQYARPPTGDTGFFDRVSMTFGLSDFHGLLYLISVIR